MIYVLGSLNLDYVARTRVPKRGETVLADSFETFCGGKGANQAVAAAKLGCKTAMIGRVGADDAGKRLKANLCTAGVDESRVLEKGADSGLAMIWVESGDNRIVVAPNANFRFETREIDEALADAKEGDILITQLEIPPAIVLHALKSAKAKGMVTILDPAPAVPDLPAEIFSFVDIIKPNETETEILTGINPTDEVHIALAVKKLYALGVTKAVLSLGKRGAVCAEGQTITLIEAQNIKVVDTTAAGDTFVGALASKLGAGFDFVTACRFANCAAQITITRKGAAESIPTLAEAEEAFELTKNEKRKTKND
ncbi:MAG: ribokinase [Firmicutes bacterium]|nr:ribokinase [Bacillota bacterium]